MSPNYMWAPRPLWWHRVLMTSSSGSRGLYYGARLVRLDGAPVPTTPLPSGIPPVRRFGPLPTDPEQPLLHRGLPPSLQIRGVTPSLDLFFQSFNLCRGGGGGHANAEGFANLQQVALFKLFTEAPSSNKGWKDWWCFIKLAESPFLRELRDRFRHHEKRRSVALEKDGRILAKIPEGRDKNIAIKECIREEDLYALGFRRYRFLGETDEKFPALEGASGGSS
ncbi:unnamed protein product [Cuscuta europaea]|uniref:Uncharacterized protein n=1 Tax=Cuscuta europaea TaxID=41803 RepID=A0A9P0ZFM7_CUSEU|nr:unnamed protein product [Cuscuta europaea]